MNPYEGTAQDSSNVALVEHIVSQRLKGSILWMVVGLLTTIGMGIATISNPNWLRFAIEHYTIFLFVELGVVFLFSMRSYSAGIMTLRGMFFAYSALNGVTFAVIALAYNFFNVVVPALIGTLAFFVAFAIVGLMTKKNLSSLTPYVVAVLIGMILSTLAMMFIGYNSTVSLILGYVGVVVFSIFTAIDMNRIKNTVTELALTEDETILDRVEITGALNLYLDFINLFLSLLRIFGNRR